jgi:hypothetical protein
MGRFARYQPLIVTSNQENNKQEIRTKTLVGNHKKRDQMEDTNWYDEALKCILHVCVVNIKSAIM